MWFVIVFWDVVDGDIWGNSFCYVLEFESKWVFKVIWFEVDMCKYYDYVMVIWMCEKGELFMLIMCFLFYIVCYIFIDIVVDWFDYGLWWF